MLTYKAVAVFPFLSSPLNKYRSLVPWMGADDALECFIDTLCFLHVYIQLQP
jgi:hypothetical protein